MNYPTVFAIFNYLMMNLPAAKKADKDSKHHNQARQRPKKAKNKSARASRRAKRK